MYTLLATALTVALAPSAEPTPLHREQARYSIGYGILGEVGTLSVETQPPTTPGAPLRTVGSGTGSFMGFGELERQMESEFDVQAGVSRRFTMQRRSPDRTVLDRAEQTQPGTVALVRRRSDRPDENQATLTSAAPVLDALGFLQSLRSRLPAADTTYQVLDGRSLWLMKVGATLPGMLAPEAGQPARPALRIEGRAEPVTWDGQPDPQRPTHTFTLWLADDTYRTPLRFSMPFGPGDVVVALTGVDHPDATAGGQRWRRLIEKVVRELERRKRAAPTS